MFVCLPCARRPVDIQVLDHVSFALRGEGAEKTTERVRGQLWATLGEICHIPGYTGSSPNE